MNVPGTIGVVCGGKAHRHIALPAAEEVRRALERLGHAAHAVDTEAPDFLERLAACDVAYIAQFGLGGDEGSLQGMCTALGKPYTGSGVLGSALSTHKVMSKRVFASAGIATPLYVELAAGATLERLAEEVLDTVGLPVIVKPVDSGGSYGISLSSAQDELLRVLQGDGGPTSRRFAEEYISGRDLTVAVLDGPGGSEALSVVELFYDSGRPFLDPVDLCRPGMVQRRGEPELEPSLCSKLRELALQVHRALGLHGLSRIDFKLDSSDKPWVLEANSLPLHSPRSDFGFAAATAGLAYEAVVERVLASAFTPRPAAS